MNAPTDRIADNLHRIQDRIAAVAANCGRTANDITLVAVTKYVDAQTTQCLVEAGCHHLGESRPQQLWDKSAALADESVNWHLVGHLQRNKIPRTIPLAPLIHSVDSLRLIEALHAAGEAASLSTKILLEVKISPDAAKHGLAPDDVPAILDSMPKYPRVKLCGFMTMASREASPDHARREFAELCGLRDRWASSAPPQVSLAELSMGMSGDFEEAIREGATIVRVGSALFEGAEP